MASAGLRSKEPPVPRRGRRNLRRPLDGLWRRLLIPPSQPVIDRHIRPDELVRKAHFGDLEPRGDLSTQFEECHDVLLGRQLDINVGPRHQVERVGAANLRPPNATDERQRTLIVEQLAGFRPQTPRLGYNVLVGHGGNAECGSV